MPLPGGVACGRGLSPQPFPCCPLCPGAAALSQLHALMHRRSHCWAPYPPPRREPLQCCPAASLLPLASGAGRPAAGALRPQGVTQALRVALPTSCAVGPLVFMGARRPLPWAGCHGHAGLSPHCCAAASESGVCTWGSSQACVQSASELGQPRSPAVAVGSVTVPGGGSPATPDVHFKGVLVLLSPVCFQVGLPARASASPAPRALSERPGCPSVGLAGVLPPVGLCLGSGLPHLQLQIRACGGRSFISWDSFASR